MHTSTPTELLLFEATPGLRLAFRPDAPQFTIAAATADICAYVGRSRDELVGRSVFEAFPLNTLNPHTAGLHTLRSSLEQVLRHKAPHRIDRQRYDVTLADGGFQELYWQHLNVPVLDGSGEVQYIIHSAEDITAVVKAEQYEEKFRHLTQAHQLILQAPTVIGSTHGPEHTLVMANEAALKLWQKPATIIGKPLLEGIPELEGQPAYEKITGVYHTGQPYLESESEVKSFQDGEEVTKYFDVYYQPYTDEGSTGVSGVFTLSNDLTQRVLARRSTEKSEHRFRRMIEDAPMAIALTRGADFVFESINDTMMKVVNRTDRSEMVGKPLSEVFPELLDQPLFPILQEVLHTGKTFSGTHVPAELWIDGKLETRYFNVTYSRLDDGTGDPLVLHVSTDVTPAVLTKRAVEESEAKLRAILNSAPTAIGVFAGPDLVIENPNQLLIDLLGGDPAIEGQSFRQLLPELVQDDQKFIEYIDGVRTTGLPFEARSVEVYFKTEKKSRHFDISFFPLCDAAGEVYAVLDVSVEVTGQVQARHELEESERRFRTLIEEAPVPTALFVGPQMVIEVANEAMLQVWGKGSAALGKPLGVALPELEGQPFLGILDRIYTTGDTYEAKGARADLVVDGKLDTYYFDYTFKPLRNTGGNVYAIMQMAMDVTGEVVAQRALEENERRLRSMILQAPVAICIFRGPSFVIEIANERMFEFWGKGEADVLGKSLFEALPEAAGQGYEELLTGVLKTGEPFAANELPVTLPRKGIAQTVYINFSYEPLRETDGSVSGIMALATEVTAQVLLRQEVEFNQRRLLTQFEESPVAIATLSADSSFTFQSANQFYAKLVGRPGTEILGKPLLEALPELNGQGFEALLAEVAGTGKPFAASEVPVEILRGKEPETIWVNLTYQPLREADDSMTSILAVAIDVTEQVRSRKQVEESEQYARSLFYNSPVAVLVYVGEDMVLREANEKMIALLGHGPDIIGQPIMETIPELEDTAMLEHYREVLRTGITYAPRAERILLVKEGKPHSGYYDYTYKALHNAAGQIYGVICTVMEVTEQEIARQALEEKEADLEQALEQMRLSKEAAGLGTFDVDMQQNTMHWDDRCRFLFGISHHEPVSYEKDFVHGLHPEDRDRVLEVIRHCFVQEVSNGDYDVEYRTIGAQDGVERWVRAKGKVYFNADAQPVRFIGSVLDITEQKDAMRRIEGMVEERTRELANANAALTATNRELQRSNQNLEEFAHAASHDLKEPIRKIQFFTSGLKTSLAPKLDDREERSFARIESATERMGQLIDDLLLYSHVSQRPHQTEPVNLREKIDRVLEDLELDISDKGAQIHIGELPVVQGYPRQLQQLLQNLLSNAIKYVRADTPPEIRIFATEREESGRHYQVLTVADNGIGFEPEYADKIFQMFQRLHGRHEYSGTGVGLSIAKKVAENHEGFIRVESRVGMGSEFGVWLPAE